MAQETHHITLGNIERAVTQRMDFEHRCIMLDSLHTIERLLKERDSLRRMYCECQAATIKDMTPQKMAECLEWDCFDMKHEADANNAAFRKRMELLDNLAELDRELGLE